MEKYFLTDNEGFDKVEDCATYIIENADLSDAYDDSLDCEGVVNVCGLKYYPSTILKEVDPIAYNCGYDDFTDSLYYDVVDMLESMKDGDTLNIYGVEVEAHNYLDN